MTDNRAPVDDGPPEITIVLADDHAVVRDGLRMLLAAEADMEVVAEAGDVEAAKRSVLGHKPTVLVLDLNMPGGSSLEAIPRVAEISPNTVVVVLTMQEDPAFAREALRAGARGYVPKHAAGSKLVQAIRAAAGGGTWLNPALGARMAAAPEGPAGALAELSEREVEVLRLIALGHTNMRNPVELMRYAVRAGSSNPDLRPLRACSRRRNWRFVPMEADRRRSQHWGMTASVLPQTIRCHACVPVPVAELEGWLERRLDELRHEVPGLGVRVLRVVQPLPGGDLEIGWLLELEPAGDHGGCADGWLGALLTDLRLLGLQPTLLQPRDAGIAAFREMGIATHGGRRTALSGSSGA